MGVKNKVEIVQELISEVGIDFSDVAYIGDDINDILLLRKVGISGCPANAPDYVKKEAKIITETKGGEGAFREFVETILKNERQLNQALELYFQSLKK